MSSLRGGRGTSRGRGNSTSAPPKGPAAAANNQTRTPRAGFNGYNARGRGNNQLVLNGSTRGGPNTRATGSRGSSASRARGGNMNTSQAAATTSKKDGLGGMPTGGNAASYQDRFQALKKKREQERAQAIAQGLLADPDKPRTLAEAITPVGTCPDMCAEFERLERVVQNDVWAAEQDPNSHDGAPAEPRMVKKFRRAAAGIDEQLPSDLRPPSVLKDTCDYLFNHVVGTSESLGAVHHFVWDRTRAIRNDFSIQQVTKPADLAIAIECYERIARFHILSLHQLAVPEKPYEKYDWYQEREQLDRTLLSLMQYYDDTAGRLESPNEPEFRAYCVIFQAQDPNPDLEERVNAWELRVRTDPRVRKALDVYNAACNILDPQGPLKPRATHPVAQEDWGHFFNLIGSNSISYLTACVSEIYFNLMRRAALNALWRSFRPQSSKHDVTDFTESVMTEMLGFDHGDQAITFCEYFGFVFKELDTVSEPFLDLNSVQGRAFPPAAQGMPHQTFSDSIVEFKRAGRTFPAIISGLSVVEAQRRGLIEEAIEGDSQMEDEDSLFIPDDRHITASAASPFSMASSNLGATPPPFAQGSAFAMSTTEVHKPSSFMSEPKKTVDPLSLTPFAVNGQSASVLNINPFAMGQNTTKVNVNSSTFGRPSSEASNNAALTTLQPPDSQPAATSQWGQGSGQVTPSPFGRPSFSPFAQQKDAVSAQPKLSPFAQSSAPSLQVAETPEKPTPLFNFLKPAASGTAGSSPAASSQPKVSPFAQSSAPSLQATETPEKPTPLFNFLKPAVSETAGSSPATPAIKGSSSSMFSTSTNTSGTPSLFANGSGTSPNLIPPKQSTPTFPFMQPATTTLSSTNLNSSGAPSIFASRSDEPSSVPPTSPQSSVFQQTSPKSSSGSSSFSFGQPTSKDGKQAPAFTQDSEKNAPSITSLDAGSAVPPKLDMPQQIAPAAPPAAKPVFATTAQPNQPKKPSPLSQSFSAAEESPITRRNRDPVFAPSATGLPHVTSNNALSSGTRPNDAIFATQVSTSAQSLPSKTTKQETPPKNKKDILQDVAREATFDRDTGFVRQYVEFHARQVILEVYDELYMESLRQLADNFRNEKLAYKFGKQWRDICWRRRLVRQGREKRERTKKHQHAKELERQLAAETNAVDDFLQSMHMNKSRGARLGQVQKSRETMASRQMDVSKTQAKGETGLSLPTNHADHVDGRGRVSKPQVSTVSTPGRALSRTNGTMSTKREPASTTRSNYFRLRALGIDPNAGNAATPSAKKRAREANSDESADASPLPRKTRVPSEPNADTSLSIGSDSLTHLNHTGSQLASNSRHSLSGEQRPPSAAEQQDEALLARARAARQIFSESATWYRAEVQKHEAQRDQEVKLVLDSPSMQRAREQARLRASGGSTMSFGSSVASSTALTPRVPAYRLRESKFVPRERYGQSVEKKQDILGSPIFFGTSMQHMDPNGVASPAMGSVGRVFSQKLQQMGEQAARAYTSRNPHFIAPGNPLPDENHALVFGPPQAMLSNGGLLPDMNDSGLFDGNRLLDVDMQSWANEALNEASVAASAEGTEDYDDEEEEPEGEEEETEESDDEEREANGFDDGEDEGSDDGFEEEEDFEEEAEEYYDEDGDVEESEEDDEQGGGSNGVLGPSAIKAGTGTAEDAFELSD